MSQQNNDEELGKLFVGGLNRQTTEDGLRKYFEQYGEVGDCVLMKDKESGLSRGFGFVTYSTPQCVAEVLKSRPHTIDNKIVDPKPCTPRHVQQQKKQTTNQFNKGHKIFIGGISMEASEDDVKSYFERYGCVLEVVFVVNKTDTTRPHKGFGFVTFADESSVDQACAKHYHSIKDKRVEAKRAESREKTDKPNDQQQHHQQQQQQQQPNQNFGNMNYGQPANMQGNMAPGMGYPQQQQPQGGMIPQQGQPWMGPQMMGQGNYGNQNFPGGYQQYPNQAYAGYGYGAAQGYGNMQQPQQQQPMGGNMGGYGNMQPNPGAMGQGMYPQPPQNMPNNPNNGAMRGQGDMGNMGGNYQQTQSGYGPTKPTDYNNMGGGGAGGGGNMGVKNDYGNQMGGRGSGSGSGGGGGGYAPPGGKPAGGNTGGGYHPYRR